MKQVFADDSWPESWRYSYAYDQQEIYGQLRHRGYVLAYNNRRERTLDLLTSVLPIGSRILDVAAGQGNFSLLLAEMGYRVTWNDLREDLAGYVRLKYELGDVSFAPGNAFDLSFPELFDAVLITEIIEHVAHPDEFLAKAGKLIRPGGYVVMTTPNGAYFRNPLPKFSDCLDPSVYEPAQFRPNADGHIFLLHPDELASIADRVGLRIDKFVLFTNPLTAGHFRTEFLLGVLPHNLVQAVESLIQHLPLRLAEALLLQMGVRFRKLWTG